ncbi:MAG: hypothetical protein GEU90_21815 [Gemmatimonas sp.]|nr:hypothetical protein [Gemmatimonas sp.]
MADQERLRRVRAMLVDCDHSIDLEDVDIARAEELEALGFADFDALHIACAERGGADLFLTTDDRLLRSGERHRSQLRIRVLNPIYWLDELSKEKAE